ncbi:MAG: putative Ig domain-containing protein [Bacteroidota bacterium]
MKRKSTFLLAFLLPLLTAAQIPLETWKFSTGDDPARAAPAFDDSAWASIKGSTVYENQGYDGYNGYSWYRVKFTLPASLREQSFLKDSLRIIVARVDDIDATYLNGVKIGQTGSFPEEPGGAKGIYDKLRRYALPANHPAIHWDAQNVIAVRVFDGGGGGGLWGLVPSVGMVDVIDFLSLNADAGAFDFSKKGFITKEVRVESKFAQAASGTLTLRVQPKKGKPLVQSAAVTLTPGGTFNHVFEFQNLENAVVTYVFSEKNTGKTLSASQITPYLLTPPEKPEPKITNAAVFGASPGKPFLWALRATGERPMSFGATGLPAGLKIDSKTGIITGSVATAGDYSVKLTAENRLGKTSKTIQIRIGKDLLCLTPPLGWNSWNCWGIAVSDERVRQSADALVSSGLVNHGWAHINVDDGWQGKHNEAGEMSANEKFPGMKALGDYLHGQGLKFGVYSSPGASTCGGLEGSLHHEFSDAKTWASWGVDYVKYDWCSYTDFLGKPQKDWSLEEQALPYRKLSDALEATGRDIIHSVCNWGMGDVWNWGKQSGGQLWRTTGDIEDSWESLYAIGFSQAKITAHASPGGWNDPDMLIVGWVGWGDKLHQTKLTPAEQYTHISLWAMLSAPLLIGCDLGRLDAFTYNLLANDELLAINQDALGKSAMLVKKTDDTQIWVKELADGSRAVAVFNLSENDRNINLNWQEMGLKGYKKLRDAWRQKDLGKAKKEFSAEVFGHGVAVLVLR